MLDEEEKQSLRLQVKNGNFSMADYKLWTGEDLPREYWPENMPTEEATPAQPSVPPPLEWYVATSNQQKAQVSRERLEQMLRNEEITRQNLVWKQGIPGNNWTPIEKVDELQEILAKLPPPMPTAPVVETVPSVPTMPVVPSVPVAETVPSVPTMPVVETVPSMPTAPVETVPSIPSVPANIPNRLVKGKGYRFLQEGFDILAGACSLLGDEDYNDIPQILGRNAMVLKQKQKDSMKIIYDLIYVDSVNKTQTKESLDFHQFILDVVEKRKIWKSVINMFYNEMNMTEEQLFGIFEQSIRDLKNIHKTFTALDEYFKTTVHQKDRGKIQGIESELSRIKNCLIRMNQIWHEYKDQ